VVKKGFVILVLFVVKKCINFRGLKDLWLKNKQKIKKNFDDLLAKKLSLTERKQQYRTLIVKNISGFALWQSPLDQRAI